MKKLIIADALKNVFKEDLGRLSGYGNKILYAKTGAEAIALHGKEKGDLIIMETDFEDMPCERFCSIVREDKSLKKVSILLVCSDKPSDIERCQKCGANDYIKPADTARFLKKAAHLLNVSERTTYRVVVSVSKIDAGQSGHILCTSHDISSSGMLLETEGLLRQGDKITCSFFLPNSVRVSAEGEVMRISVGENGTTGYGVRFVNISPTVESQITSFVEYWRAKRKNKRS